MSPPNGHQLLVSVDSLVERQLARLLEHTLAPEELVAGRRRDLAARPRLLLLLLLGKAAAARVHVLPAGAQVARVALLHERVLVQAVAGRRALLRQPSNSSVHKQKERHVRYVMVGGLFLFLLLEHFLDLFESEMALRVSNKMK